MAKYNGTIMNLYLAPVTDVDADPQAADGYTPAVADYTRLGNSTNVDLGRSRDTIDLSDKDSGLDPDAVAGRRSGEITSTVNVDDEGEPGQEIQTDAFNSERGEVWYFVSQDKDGKKEYWGRAILSDSSLSWPEEDVSTMQFSATHVGPFYEGVADFGTAG